MKFYLAGKHERREMIGFMIARLVEAGHECTFDWTREADYDLGFTDPITTSELCKMGVDMCDGFIMILPGGPGTHVELGIARAKDKPVLLAVQENCRDLLNPSSGRIFYHGDKITNVLAQQYSISERLIEQMDNFLCGVWDRQKDND